MYIARKKEPVRVPFDADKINALLGTDIPEEDMIKYFEKIDLEYDAEAKEVIAPTSVMTYSVSPILRKK